MTHVYPHSQPIWDAQRMRWLRPAQQTTGITDAATPKLGFSQFDYLVMPFVLALLLTFAIVYPLVSLDQGGIVPDELVGTWKTAMPEYADREFRITKTALVFQNGGEKDSVTAHQIRKVASVPSGNKQLYTIRYTASLSNLKDLYTFSFFYQSQDSVIQFKNQPNMVWRKKSDSNQQASARGATR